MAEELPILWRDEQLVVIDKPPHLLVHRSEIDRHETRFAIQILRDQTGRRVWPAHRLDRGTSGILPFGLSPEIAGALAHQFADGTMSKRYLAVVRGHPPLAGDIDHPLSRRRDDYEFRGKRSSDFAQPALTRYRRLATVECRSPSTAIRTTATPCSNWSRSLASAKPRSLSFKGAVQFY